MDGQTPSDGNKTSTPWRNRRRLLGTIAAFSVAPMTGCIGGDGGGDGGDSGGDGSGGDGLYEGSEFTCADIGDASYTEYDASGTAFLASFEYPDVFDTVDESGTPAQTVRFPRRFGGDEGYTEDLLQLTVIQFDTPQKRSDIDTDSEAVTEVAFGDRTAYVFPELRQTDQPNKGNFTANVPYEVDEGIRYFLMRFELIISIQTAGGDRDAPEDCATTLDETCRRVAESIVPNAETEFTEAE